MHYFFNCDWGTTHFRLRLVQTADRQIVDECSSDEGAIQLANAAAPADRPLAFQSVLDRSVSELLARNGADLRQAPILISGMASSSIGWRELPYAPLPLALDGRNLYWQRIAHVNHQAAKGERPEDGADRPIYLLSGVRSERDVMRGEETELLGLGVLISELSQLDTALVILPGTHSKHIWLSRGEIVDLQTHMTGELFDLLSRRSSLRHPAYQPGAVRDESAGCEAAFREGIELARQRTLTSTLFQVRIGQVLQGRDAPASAALLSGMLIGSELAALAVLAAQQNLRNTPIFLCAGRQVSDNYHTALGVLGLTDALHVIPPTEVERLSALGQWAALQQIQAHESSGQAAFNPAARPVDIAPPDDCSQSAN